MTEDSTLEHAWRDHDDAARFGAQRYIEHLRRALNSSDVSTNTESVVACLVESIESALMSGRSLRPDQVSFSAAALSRMPHEERYIVINQWGLGIGNSEAKIVVMGTEHAFDPLDDRWVAGLALESCASQLLWLSGDEGDLSSAVAADSSFRPQDGVSGYLVRPTAYYSVASGHTWRRVSRALNVDFESLFKTTYQVERSATAALRASSGVLPTAERTEFLSELLRLFSRTATLLLLHGRVSSDDAAWDQVNRELAAAFLALPPGFRWEQHQTGPLTAMVARHFGRAVIALPALNGRTRGIWDAIQPIRGLVRDLLEA